MPAGRPPKFTSATKLQERIEDYFDTCRPKFEGDILVSFGHPTVTGLAYFLGFESRQSMYDYEKNEKFSYIIKRARLFIESKYEETLTSPIIKPTGAIFALKNMGWSDKPDNEEISDALELYKEISDRLENGTP
jgi:hypothetical protein